jgi:hypothetical protein
LLGKVDLIAEDVLHGPWADRLVVVEGERDRRMVRRFQLAMRALLADDAIAERLCFKDSDKLLRLQRGNRATPTTLRSAPAVDESVRLSARSLVLIGRLRACRIDRHLTRMCSSKAGANVRVEIDSQHLAWALVGGSDWAMGSGEPQTPWSRTVATGQPTLKPRMNTRLPPPCPRQESNLDLPLRRQEASQP